MASLPILSPVIPRLMKQTTQPHDPKPSKDQSISGTRLHLQRDTLLTHPVDPHFLGVLMGPDGIQCPPLAPSITPPCPSPLLPRLPLVEIWTIAIVRMRAEGIYQRMTTSRGFRMSHSTALIGFRDCFKLLQALKLVSANVAYGSALRQCRCIHASMVWYSVLVGEYQSKGLRILPEPRDLEKLKRRRSPRA